MSTSIKPVLLASLLISVLSVPFAQAAEEAAAPAAAPASPHTLSTNIGFFTDYTFRGISYTRERGVTPTAAESIWAYGAPTFTMQPYTATQ